MYIKSIEECDRRWCPPHNIFIVNEFLHDIALPCNVRNSFNYLFLRSHQQYIYTSKKSQHVAYTGFLDPSATWIMAAQQRAQCKYL